MINQVVLVVQYTPPESSLMERLIDTVVSVGSATASRISISLASGNPPRGVCRLDHLAKLLTCDPLRLGVMD